MASNIRYYAEQVGIPEQEAGELIGAVERERQIRLEDLTPVA